MNKLLQMLANLTKEKFWGEIRIKFKDGNIELIHKEEQIKP